MVHPTKAVRLKRIKPGYFKPPGGRPILMPGSHWLMITVRGPKEHPNLAHLRWWTTRGVRASDRCNVETTPMAETGDRWAKKSFLSGTQPRVRVKFVEFAETRFASAVKLARF